MRWTALWKAETKLIVPKLPIILLCVLAILFSLVVSLPPSLLVGKTTGDITVMLVCRANPTLTKMIVGMMGDYDFIKRVSVEVDEETADAKLKAGEADILLIIPQNVESALFYGNPLTVKVKAADAFFGTMAYQFAASTVDISNMVASITGYVYDKNQEAGTSSHEGEEQLYGFVNQVLLDAIMRYSSIDYADAPHPYETQVVALFQFLVAAISSVFIAVVSAGQVSDGYLRRLTVRGFPVWRVIAVKLTTAAILSLVLSLFALTGFYLLHIEYSLFKYFFAVVMLSVIVTSICLSVLIYSTSRAASHSKTMLSCTAALFLLLFFGGGFYPTYLMQFSFRSLNPAWLSHLLADRSLSGSFPSPGAFAPFLLPFAACTVITIVRFRRAVRC